MFNIFPDLTFLVWFLNFLFIIYLLFLFLAVLGLRFGTRAFSSCGKWGPLFIAARGPLTIAASLVPEQRLQMLRLSSCGSRAQLLRGMWDLPGQGLKPVSPALAGGFSNTAPPGKPPHHDSFKTSLSHACFKTYPGIMDHWILWLGVKLSCPLPESHRGDLVAI